MTKELNTIVCRFIVFKIVHCQTMIDQAFAIVLRRLRTEKGLSQEKFGFEADLHRTYIGQLERGLKSPSLKTLHKIAQALGISLTELMALVEQESNVRSDR